MKKTILSTLLILFPFLASAYDVEIDGIYYNLVKKAHVAEVTYKNTSYNSYSGNIIIPETILYEGEEYTVTSIGDNAFESCSGLTSVSIPNTVTNIGNFAFSWCNNLTLVTIPNSVIKISSYVFAYCTSLTSITIPNTVTSIEHEAFSGCSGLTSIIIPNSVTSIGRGVFSMCSGLTSVTIPNSLTSIREYVFRGCSGLTSITIPNSVTSIGECAFSGCFGLTSVTIPHTVTSIGVESFSNCNGLTSVVIGNSINKIGNSAFANCQNIEKVYCFSENVPNTNSNVFEGSYPEYATLYVPEASLSKYETTVPWSYFGTKLPIEGTGVTQMKVSVPIVQAESGNIFVSGIGESDRITVYLTDGKQVATAKAQNGTASIATNISKGMPVIVKIGEKAVKVVMR